MTGKNTCVAGCLSGYTFDKTDPAKICFPCDESCATCRDGGDVGDRDFCTSCAPGFPFFWSQEAKCFPYDQGCPDGAFEFSTHKCKSCPDGCNRCTGADQCLKCDENSEFPLLQGGKCTAECETGSTPVYTLGYGVCENCVYPCATCAERKPEHCTSCASGDLQFLFGSQCLAQCPKGTTRNVLTGKCIGCLQGCKECALEDNS